MYSDTKYHTSQPWARRHYISGATLEDTNNDIYIASLQLIDKHYPPEDTAMVRSVVLRVDTIITQMVRSS